MYAETEGCNLCNKTYTGKTATQKWAKYITHNCKQMQGVRETLGYNLSSETWNAIQARAGVLRC